MFWDAAVVFISVLYVVEALFLTMSPKFNFDVAVESHSDAELSNLEAGPAVSFTVEAVQGELPAELKEKSAGVGV